MVRNSERESKGEAVRFGDRWSPVERVVKVLLQRGEIQASCFRICTTCRGTRCQSPSRGLEHAGRAPQPRQVAMRPTDGWLRLGGGCVEQERLQYDRLEGAGGDQATVELRGTGVQRRREVPQGGQRR